MRFKASLTRENTIHLYNIISQLEKLGKVAAIFATTTSIKIAVVAENMEAPKCYAEVFVHSLFQDYKINSLSDDSILFEIGLENFVRLFNYLITTIFYIMPLGYTTKHSSFYMHLLYSTLHFITHIKSHYTALYCIALYYIT